MKKKLIIVIGVLLIAGIVNSLIYRLDIKQKSTDAYKFKKEYESLNGKRSESGKTYRTLNISKNNRIKYSTAKEIVEKIENNETFIVYFGFAKCPWCRSMVENLLELADKNEVDIYYVDVLDIRDIKEVKDDKLVETRKGDKYYLKLLDKMDNVLEDYLIDGFEVNEKRIYAPNVVTVVQGHAEKMNEGISKDLKDPYGKITDKMKKESINQLKCNFKCLEKAAVCTKPSSC